mmetsp:Transcript_102925/g.300319  ORF Transcript_102925/g.300319 Transcript_102925/m.300319 type:complete len:246 (+) Transcript_102925:541-1278(+)
MPSVDLVLEDPLPDLNEDLAVQCQVPWSSVFALHRADVGCANPHRRARAQLDVAAAEDCVVVAPKEACPFVQHCSDQCNLRTVRHHQGPAIKADRRSGRGCVWQACRGQGGGCFLHGCCHLVAGAGHCAHTNGTDTAGGSSASACTNIAHGATSVTRGCVASTAHGAKSAARIAHVASSNGGAANIAHAATSSHGATSPGRVACGAALHGTGNVAHAAPVAGTSAHPASTTQGAAAQVAAGASWG